MTRTVDDPRSRSFSSVNVFATSVIAAATTTAAVGYYLHRRHVREREQYWNDRRHEERRGRTRAEVQLRQTTKALQRMRLDQHDRDGDAENNGDDTAAGETAKTSPAHLTMKAIGTMVTPYTKRMGTPRQPQLVPSSRGYLQLHVTTPSETLDGIAEYSHVWLLFGFHANTDMPVVDTPSLEAESNGGPPQRSSPAKTKVRPPRAGGIKVGQLATRSPHRPNPVGLSLVKLQHWNSSSKQLHVSGLDLVHNTPVYDVKPCVPWDVPGMVDVSSVLHVPPWVSHDDALPHVTWRTGVQPELARLVQDEQLAPLYTSRGQGAEAAIATIEEILAQDPRSSHKGLKHSRRGTKSNGQKASKESAQDAYSFIFCKIKVSFCVYESSVQVQSVEPVSFDASSYVEGIPLYSEQKQHDKA